MTSPDAAAAPVDPHWAAWITAENQAQAEYNAAVSEAQRNFTLDVKPAIDTYHSVERAAWQRYLMTHRALKRTYLESIGTLPAMPTPQAVPPIPIYPTDKRTDQEARAAWLPTFTPTQEREP